MTIGLTCFYSEIHFFSAFLKTILSYFTMHSYSLMHRINLKALLDDSNGKQNIFFTEAQFCKMLRSSCKAQGDLEFH